MRIVSVNVGCAEPVERSGGAATTGIRKRPIQGAVSVSAAGLDGDAIVDTRYHGGPDQAVYAYSAEDYAWWSSSLGRTLDPGTFGENLTVAGLPSDINVGDRLLIGNVVLEGTAPRIPCGTLAARMDDKTFGLRFRRAERPGFYFRVLNEGEVATGDGAELVETGSSDVTMIELFRYAYVSGDNPADLRRFLGAPIASRLRTVFARRLDALEGAHRPD